MRIRGVLLDIAGVVHDGEKPIAGALSSIDQLRDTGLSLRFVTNTTRSSKQMILEKLAGIGLYIKDNELFTPTEAAVAWLARHNSCAACTLVHPALAPDLEKSQRGTTRSVIVGDAGEGFNYASLNNAFREILNGASLLALAKNRYFQDSDKRLSLDAGAFVTALEYASGQTAVTVGKPSPDFFHAALASIPCAAKEAVMVGDDAESDVAGALNAGIGAALLVKTGKYTEGDENKFMPVATNVVSDLSAAVDWIIAHHRQQDL